MIELTDAGYVPLGSAVNFAVEEAKRAVRSVLTAEPLTSGQLVEATGLKRTSVYAAVMELVEAGVVRREGKGTKGDPYHHSTVE
ncbi:MAG: helix-turn-helix domain-containing protein [Chloroflexi bacterium]|nr:helix-turn-helix domain-containing protein [Chloroflexota bacterium]